MEIVDTKLGQLYEVTDSKMSKCPHCGLRRKPENIHVLVDYEYRDSFNDTKKWCERFVAECVKCNMVYSLYVVKDVGKTYAFIIETLEDAVYAVSLNIGMYQIIPFKFQTPELDLL